MSARQKSRAKREPIPAPMAPDVKKDDAVIAALTSLAKAGEAYKAGLFGAMDMHQRDAARTLIEAWMPEAA